jgi:hypothetical protein
MLRRLVLLAAVLLTCLPLRAQQALPSGSHRFAGVWSGNGFVYAFRMALTVGREGSATGEIHWTLVEAPGERTDVRRLDEGTEWVVGSVEPGGRIELRGTRVDRKDLIAADEYELVLAPNGTLSGRTRGEGEWPGRLAGLMLPHP